MASMSAITENDLERMLLDKTAEPKALPFDLLAKITNGFSDELEIGRGGFAIVYKAMLKNGGVAVKRLLPNSYLYEKEFQREIKCLMKVKHEHIVRFLGYCADIQRSVGTYNGEFVMTDLEHRLLCFQYLPKGSLHGHIKDASGGLEWRQRYKIIKGICEGLCYLHDNNILHLDLKPDNILLDENMLPKITDFGMSRFLDKGQTRFDATKVGGTMGYLPPEYTSRVITPKFDLYSLGVVMMEILTGEKGYQAIENVMESWSNRLHILQGSPEWEQIKVCTEIGKQCTKFNPAKRPSSMKDIMDRLVKTEGHELFEDPRLEHRFYPELSESIPCMLHLTNKGDVHVAFRLVERSSESLRPNYSASPLYGVMPPRSSCTLIMTSEEKELAETNGIDLVLQSSISRDRSTEPLEYYYQFYKFFEAAEELGHAVYEVALKPIDISPSSEAAVRPTSEPTDNLVSMDVHPTEPWILIGGSSGDVSIRNHESKTTTHLFTLSDGPVHQIKFHATKKWILCRTYDKIHVYDCACVTKMQNITSFIFRNDSFAIHPTKPYIMSGPMELINWDNRWQSTDRFAENGSCSQLVFNPEDPNILASAPIDGSNVKVSSLASPETDYYLRGHSDVVNCLAFFKHDDRLCLITGSMDCTAKIWDLRTKACIHTMEIFVSSINHVISIPGRPYIVTCSAYSTIHVWSSIDFSIKTTINFICGGEVRGLACFMGSRSIAIGQMRKISIMDICVDEE